MKYSTPLSDRCTDLDEFRDESRRSIAREPDLPPRGIPTQHDGTVSTLSRHIQKARHEAGAFAQIDAAEHRDTCTAMSMDVEDADFVRQSPLHRLANGRGAHHHGNRVVPNIVLIRHGPVLLGQEHEPAAA